MSVKDSESSGPFSLERVVVLLTPVFGALASWIVALVANNVPGAPALSATGVEGIEIAVFLAVAGVVVKFLQGRQQTQAEAHQRRMAGVASLDEARLRSIVRQEVRGEVEGAAKAIDTQIH